MSEIIASTNEYKTRVKSEDGLFYVETVFNDKEQLKQNDRIRASGMLEKAQLGLHEKEDIRGVLSIPSVILWNYFKRNNPITYALLQSPDEEQRISAMQKIYEIHPEWFVYDRF